MRSNFTDYGRVRELGDARSYASRLFDYMGSGRNQIAAVLETLRRDAHASYATITTLEPLTIDVSYPLCEFTRFLWLRSGSLELSRLCSTALILQQEGGFGNLVPARGAFQRDTSRAS